MIKYKPGIEQANADSLSHLPLPDAPETVPLPGELVLHLETLQTSPFTSTQIRQWTGTDPLLSRI